ncbi:MAG: signal peptide peptidase SppA [Halanaeroarchaeum sp.]
MNDPWTRLGRSLLAVIGTVVAAVVGIGLFVVVPDGNLARLLGVVFAIVLAVLGARMASGIAAEWFPSYNVASVSVDGPIARQRGQTLPGGPVLHTAEDVVEQIERADSDESVDALVVSLNTPGGEVVPSDDIRRAVEDFDGPTVGYAIDTCASGGYWIASGCDHIVAREGSIVGSIGVVASRVTGEDLLDRLGLTYERLVAGEYKDAGVPLRDLEADEREYLQDIVDDYYDAFIDRVAAGRDVDRSEIEATEARVFLGPDAKERGLVDEIGAADAVEAWIESEIDEPVEIREFEPALGLANRLRAGTERTAYALGAGIASAVVGDRNGTSTLEFR